jgi:hypothetical protein
MSDPRLTGLDEALRKILASTAFLKRDEVAAGSAAAMYDLASAGDRVSPRYRKGFDAGFEAGAAWLAARLGLKFVVLDPPPMMETDHSGEGSEARRQFLLDLED